MTETRTEVFDVIGKGLVTSSLCPQDTLLNCTSDPVSTTACLCFFFPECLKIFVFSSHCQAINSELWTNTYCRSDYNGYRGTVCHSLLFGKAGLL